MSSGRIAVFPAGRLRVVNCATTARPNGAPFEPRSVGRIVTVYSVAGRSVSAGWNVTVLPAESAAPGTVVPAVTLLTTMPLATDVESIGMSNTACGRNGAFGSSIAPFAGVSETRCGGLTERKGAP